jgi:hypothetical protein
MYFSSPYTEFAMLDRALQANHMHVEDLRRNVFFPQLIEYVIEIIIVAREPTALLC